MLLGAILKNGEKLVGFARNDASDLLFSESLGISMSRQARNVLLGPLILPASQWHRLQVGLESWLKRPSDSVQGHKSSWSPNYISQENKYGMTR
ncbi:unnamed protein product [Protopolystoma xenopodis]|uniref:Uncharacterized protein n=1 Tax=Protopolystoma xenopodis TaxID=117903 RepID=A0A448X6E3_9PLAT|nr:unnamed protein product [Protopolystoma xenopodis]